MCLYKSYTLSISKISSTNLDEELNISYFHTEKHILSNILQHLQWLTLESGHSVLYTMATADGLFRLAGGCELTLTPMMQVFECSSKSMHK